MREYMTTIWNPQLPAAFAFRGYNLTNLGRTPELLAHPAFGPVFVCGDEVHQVR
jgi:hypothetical protein